MKISHLCVAATLCTSLISCEKELDIKYHDIDPLTVIEGELTPDGIRVGITLTTPMDEPMDRTRLTDAVVTLTDISSDASYALTADTDGYFCNSVSGIAGHSYRLKVSRNGSIYEAEATMYAPTEITGLEFNWIKMPYDHVAVLQGQFTDVPGCDSYWVKIFRNNEIYRWSEMNGNGSVDGILTFVAMTTRQDTDKDDDSDVLYDGDVVTATVSAISRNMYDYLEALQNDSNGPSMFTGDRCLGYFIATSPVSKTIVFHPDDIPLFK